MSSEANAIIKYATDVSGNCSGGTAVYTDYSAPFEIEDETNEGKMCFYAIDEAGNTESVINEETYEIDTDAPESHALALPTYTNTQIFDVAYTTSSSADLDYVELYYSYEG